MSIVQTNTGLVVKPLDNYFGNANTGPLPQPSFMTLIVAPKGSGKTTFAINMLSYYEKCFHRIYIFSRTIHLDPKWKPFLEKLDQSREKKVYTSFDPSVLERIYHRREVEKTKENTLIIYDDMISDDKTFAKWSKNAITGSIYNQRHFGISTIIISQKYTEIPSNIRNQLDSLIISRLSGNELDHVYKTTTGISDMPQDTFNTLYKYATLERFDFLVVNIPMRELYKNFDRIEWKEVRAKTSVAALERETARLHRKNIKKEARARLKEMQLGGLYK